MKRRNLELALLLAGGALALRAEAILSSRTQGGLGPAFLALYLGPFFGAHIILRLRNPRAGQVYLPAAMFLTGASLFVLAGFPGGLGRRFAAGTALGCVAFVAAACARLDKVADYRYSYGLAALALSLLLASAGTGPAGSDARINLLGLFQPVEAVKLLAILFLGAYLADRQPALRRLDGRRWGPLSMPRMCDIRPVALFLAAAIALFLIERDLGPALVLYLVFLAVFVTASGRAMLGLAGLGALVAAFASAYRSGLFKVVAGRIEMWLSPWDNRRAGGAQLAEALWALAAGGRYGSGIGRADPGYIPAGHTDLILAALGETYGFAGLVLLLALVSFLLCSMVRSCLRVPDLRVAFAGLGIAFEFGIQWAVIALGTVGLTPLTGIPFPFMSYGKSALLVHFFALGLLTSISGACASGPRPAAHPGRTWAAIVTVMLLVALAAVGRRAYEVGCVSADNLLSRPVLAPQADGVRRFIYNRRILDLARRIPRGRILDRHGLPLAADVEDPSSGRRQRFYPLGAAAVQLLGNARGLWADSRTVERAADERLRGYLLPRVLVPVDGAPAVRVDYAALATPFRERFQGSAGAFAAFESRPRDVRLALDAQLQLLALRALEKNLAAGGAPAVKAAAVVLAAHSGEVLACVSLPGYDPNAADAGAMQEALDPKLKAAYDRARFEIYPPGSSFKLVVAAAALESAPASAWGEHDCRHVAMIPWEYGGHRHRRRVTDDEREPPHRKIGLERALVESCNVYFAALGVRLGAQALYRYAHDRLGLDLAGIASPADLEPNLPDNAYGQGKITVTPLEMARIAAAVANGGLRVEPMLYLDPPAETVRPARAMSQETAATLRAWMVEAVRFGTGRRAAVPGLVVGGKTGTAQDGSGDRRSHAWFVGFAHREGSPPESALAFAFLIENGGYGGRAAAQAAHDFLEGCFSTANMEERIWEYWPE